ncbi:MAG: hypothetical protein HRT67_06395, partial [Flavobacteriaceae bacterium]|nr:hypothetical protein [Flavobacteriaceae bacterium]
MKKYIYIACILVLSTQFLYSQVGIGTTNPDASAILELESSSQGFLPPVMTNLQIKAIANPATGLIAFSTDDGCLINFNGNTWTNVCTGLDIIVPLGTDDIKLKSDNTETTDYFGFSVYISSDVSKMAVGALLEDSDASGNGNGVL